MWNPVTSILLKTDWQYTEPVEGSYFRLKHSSFPVNSSYLLAQAQVNLDGSVELADIQEFIASSESQVICLKAPPVFSDASGGQHMRRIAIKRVAKQSSLASELRRIIRNDLLEDADIEFTARRSTWSVALEVSDYVAPVITGGGGSPTATEGTQLTYASDGDTNGVFYWLGTNFGTEAWSNPNLAGRLIITPSNAPQSGTVDLLVNRAENNFFIGGAANFNKFLTFDLGTAHALIVNYYSLKA